MDDFRWGVGSQHYSVYMVYDIKIKFPTKYEKYTFRDAFIVSSTDVNSYLISHRE